MRPRARPWRGKPGIGGCRGPPASMPRPDRELPAVLEKALSVCLCVCRSVCLSVGRSVALPVSRSAGSGREDGSVGTRLASRCEDGAAGTRPPPASRLVVSHLWLPPTVICPPCNVVSRLTGRRGWDYHLPAPVAWFATRLLLGCSRLRNRPPTFMATERGLPGPRGKRCAPPYGHICRALTPTRHANLLVT